LRPHWQKDPRDWYQVDADRNPPSSYPLSGRGLVVGIDDRGATCDARISLDELKSRITFTRRRFKGFDIKRTFPGSIAITAATPIIDDEPINQKKTMRERPESWNAKMPISGGPLITDEQFEQLLANTPPESLEEMRHHNPKPVVKIFLPHVRWLLVWGYPDHLDRFFCVTKYGQKEPEAGDVRLSDIVSARLGMMQPERDLYTKLDKPWTQYLDKSNWS
jgi:hypothetical protein